MPRFGVKKVGHYSKKCEVDPTPQPQWYHWKYLILKEQQWEITTNKLYFTTHSFDFDIVSIIEKVLSPFHFITLKSSNFLIILLNIMSCVHICQISKKNIIAHVQLKEIPLFLWQFYQIQEEKLAKGLNLAKDLQYKVSQNYCHTSSISLCKFVIPNLKCEL